MNQFISLLQQITQYLAAGVEGLAAIIIGVAAIQAAIRSLLLFLHKPISELKPQQPSAEDIRLRLGRFLALALEFELGADILRTAIAPSWSDIAQLAAIAAIRTALNYFLQQEIDKATERQQHLNPVTGAPKEVERQEEVNALR